MAGRPPIPIANLTRRIPEAGRIRTGEKRTSSKGKEYPAARPTFRFTSAERENVAQVAAIYGGEVEPFSDPKSPDRWQVSTDASEIRIALPADPLGGTPIYQMYGGGGPERRCDGVTCERWRKGPDGPEPYEQDCVCAAGGVLECDVTTHLSVFIEGVRLTGVWRLTTKSYNAAQELPGMVDAIRGLQDAGIIKGVLWLKPHQQTLAGETRKFLVPTLGVDESMEALVAGQASVAALPAPAPAAETPVAIGSGGGGEAQHETGGERTTPTSAPEPPTPSGHDQDDDIVDAEIVEDGGGEPVGPQPAAGEPSGQPSAAPSVPGSTDLQDLADLMAERHIGKAAVRRVYNEHAERLGEPEVRKFDEIGPGPVLDAAYAEMAGDDPDPDPSSGASAPAAGDPSGGDPPASSEGEPATREQTQQALIMRIQQGSPRHGRERHDAARHALIRHVTEGRTESSREASKDELLAAHRVLDEVEAGTVELFLRSNGGYEVRTKRGAAA